MRDDTVENGGPGSRSTTEYTAAPVCYTPQPLGITAKKFLTGRDATGIEKILPIQFKTMQNISAISILLSLIIILVVVLIGYGDWGMIMA